MLRKRIEKEEWAKISPAFKVGNVQYYYLHVDPMEVDGYIDSIEELYPHKPTNDDAKALYSRWLELAKSAKLHEIETYAKSSDVKSYTINSTTGWEDSDARTSITKAALDKKNAGRDVYTLHHGGASFTMSPDRVVEILSAVEVYASDCYDVTERLKENVLAIETIRDVEGYTYTDEYPEKLAFTL